eukprot:4261080-Pyramimonas_sp.AAC.1
MGNPSAAVSDPLQGPLVIFGDGSGGEFSSDPRRRRCGAGVAILQADPVADLSWSTVWAASAPL